jgi:catechol 2,3-dioxygenase-like lactoylglutathione lyase family enzyme
MRVNYAIVFVSDMKRAISFYRDVLGLPLRFDSPGWTEFATDGATLALHLAEAPKSGGSDGYLRYFRSLERLIRQSYSDRARSRPQVRQKNPLKLGNQSLSISFELSFRKPV